MKKGVFFYFLLFYFYFLISANSDVQTRVLSQNLISALFCNNRGYKIGTECSCMANWSGKHCEQQSNVVNYKYFYSF